MHKETTDPFRVVEINEDTISTKSVGDKADFNVSDSTHSKLDITNLRFQTDHYSDVTKEKIPNNTKTSSSRNYERDRRERQDYSFRSSDTHKSVDTAYYGLSSYDNRTFYNRLLSTISHTAANTFKSSDNLGLESVGESIETVRKTSNRLMQIINASRLRTMQTKAKKTSSKATANTKPATSSYASDSFGCIGVILILLLIAFICIIFVYIGIYTIIFSSGALLGSTDRFYWPLESYKYVSSPFGERKSMYINGKWTSEYHNGIDIPAPNGTPIGAAASGIVKLTSLGSEGYGNHVIITHEDGYETVYAHMMEILVEMGQQVFATEIIGTVGSTGTSSGYHLHFEIRIFGYHLDPLSVEYMDWTEIPIPV